MEELFTVKLGEQILNTFRRDDFIFVVTNIRVVRLDNAWRV